jgi:hypothetical protein
MFSSRNLRHDLGIKICTEVEVVVETSVFVVKTIVRYAEMIDEVLSVAAAVVVRAAV